MSDVDVAAIKVGAPQVKLGEAQAIQNSQKAKSDQEAEQKKIESPAEEVDRAAFGTGAVVNLSA